MERHLIQELPCVGAIEPPNPRCLDDRGIEVPEIDPHPLPTARDRLPVRYAAACRASAEREALVTPYVAVDVALASGDLYLAGFVVAPDAPVAATDRAVAARKPAGLARDLDLNCTAMTRSLEHGATLRAMSWHSDQRKVAECLATFDAKGHIDATDSSALEFAS